MASCDILRPEKEEEARAVFEKWDLDFAIVGETIAEDRFLVLHWKHSSIIPYNTAC